MLKLLSSVMGVGKTGDSWSLMITAFLAFFTFVAWYLKFHWDKRRLYRMSANVPGPKGYPIFGNSLDFVGGETTDVIWNTVTRYFSTYPNCFKFWLGPKLVFGISKPEHIEIVLNHPQCLSKDSFYDFTRCFLGDGLLAAPVNVWRKNRKIINPTFNQKILDSFVGIFCEQAKILTKILGEKFGEELEIFELVSDCNTDTICETAMGVKVNAQTNGNEFGKMLNLGMEIVCLRIFSPWYQSEFIFRLTKYWQQLCQCLDSLNSFTGSVIVEKKEKYLEEKRRLRNGEVIQEKSKRKTFLELLLQLSDETTMFTDKELRDEVNTFMAAGSDTTAATICFCFITMGMHPEIQEKLHKEVLDVLGEDRDITPQDMPSLQYMERFIKETLRCFPVGPLVVRKPLVDIDLGDVVVPANSSIMMNVSHVHRSPKYWKDPLKFDPERFLPDEVAKRHPYTYLPFSAGPRGCIGSKYAMMAMKSILSSVVRKLVFKTDYKSIEGVDLKLNLLLRPLNGFRVSVEGRG